MNLDLSKPGCYKQYFTCTLLFVMRLSNFSDYSLRVLMYLAADADRLATISEIAAGHDISENHLMKVVHQLGRYGYLETVRGKGGGMRLARSPGEIVVGEVLRQTETDFTLAECLGSDAACRIQAACGLKRIFNEALSAMFLVLDSYTLADLLHDPRGLVPAARTPAAVQVADA